MAVLPVVVGWASLPYGSQQSRHTTCAMRFRLTASHVRKGIGQSRLRLAVKRLNQQVTIAGLRSNYHLESGPFGLCPLFALHLSSAGSHRVEDRERIERNAAEEATEKGV
jgi:hypothetical protein